MGWRSFDLTQRFTTLLVFLLTGIVFVLILENALGADLTPILYTIGGTSFISYFVISSLKAGIPRYAAAKKYLNIGLGLLGIGTLVVSIAVTERILVNSGLSSLGLEFVGMGIFVSGIFVMLLALVLIHPKPLRN